MIMTMIIDLYADVMTLLVMAEHYRHGNNDDYNDVVQFPVEQSACGQRESLHVVTSLARHGGDDDEYV